MKVVISRKYGTLQTTGRLVIFNDDKVVLQLVTIELPDNGNQRNSSCIPEGIYKVTKYDSPTKGECFKVLAVQGRSDILIHKGNYASGNKVDTKGCILPGIYFEDINSDGNLDVAESTSALNRMLNILPEKFQLYII